MPVTRAGSAQAAGDGSNAPAAPRPPHTAGASPDASDATALSAIDALSIPTTTTMTTSTESSASSSNVMLLSTNLHGVYAPTLRQTPPVCTTLRTPALTSVTYACLPLAPNPPLTSVRAIMSLQTEEIEENRSVLSHQSNESQRSTASRIEARVRAAEYECAQAIAEAQRRRAAEEERVSIELAKKKLDADLAAARATLEDEVPPPAASERAHESERTRDFGVRTASPRVHPFHAECAGGIAPPGVRCDIAVEDGEDADRHRNDQDPIEKAGCSRTAAWLHAMDTNELQPNAPEPSCERDRRSALLTRAGCTRKRASPDNNVPWCERDGERRYDIAAQHHLDTLNIPKRQWCQPPPPPPQPTVAAANVYAAPPPSGRRDPTPALQLRPISCEQMKCLADAIKRASRPPSLLPNFNGDVREFLAFRASYRDSTAVHKYSSAENMIRLRNALKGEAREIVAARLFTTGDPDAIMTILERHYGRPEILIATEVQRVMNLPRLCDNVSDLRMISSRVDNCVATIKEMGYPAYLHSPELVRSILGKMSVFQRAKYIEYSKGRTYELTGVAELETINNFLTSEAENSVRLAAYDTTPTSTTREKTGQHVSRSHVRTGATKRPRETTPYVYAAVHGENTCACCRQSHTLAHCDVFAANTLDERWSIVKRSGVCFKCLVGKHRYSECKSRPCGVNRCPKPHHRLLHKSSEPSNNIRGRNAELDKGAPPGDGNRNMLTRREGIRMAPSGGDRSRDSNVRQTQYESYGKRTCQKPLDDATSQLNTENPLLRTTFVTGCAVTSRPARCYNRTLPKEVFLKIAPVTLQGPTDVYDTFALLDDGSTITLLADKAANKIGVNGPSSTLNVMGIGGQINCSLRSRQVDIKIAARDSDEWHVLESVRTVDNIGLGSQTINRPMIDNCAHLSDLSEQLLYIDAMPTILVGQDNWQLIVTRELREGRRNQPVASKTALGWVLHGFRSAADSAVSFQVLHMRETTEDELHRLVRANYNLEALGVIAREPRVPSDERALHILERTVKKTANNRYEAGLLWNDENCLMPPSKDQALVRLRSIERKMKADTEFEAQYKNQIRALLNSGYAEICKPEPSPYPVWYLPHFAVRNPRKPGKIRVVFDAAAQVNNVSLNHKLLTGPDLLQPLLGVLFRFREGAIAVAGDIKEMFLRIEMRAQDRDAQRFVWRENPDKPPQDYRMTTLIFGAASSPCTALYVKNKNASVTTSDPEVIAAIERDHYMDDAIISTDSESKATYLVDAVTATHAAGGFEIRGWTSNRAASLRNIAVSARGSGIVDLATSAASYERTLGMIWHTKSDELAFDLSMHRVPQEVATGDRKPTKRQMLSLVMSIFDPLGVLSIITTAAKILLQRAWRTAIGWDVEIDDNLYKTWKDWLQHLRNLRDIRIPRHYGGLTNDAAELHIFCDASAEAYAAVAYWRIQCDEEERNTTTVLVASKSRVAPLRPVSIPRLELQAALLGVRLAVAITKEHRMRSESVTYWSDSRTALTWIRAEARRYKPFVAHRVAEIQELTNPDQWRWVPTQANAADLATRPPPSEVNSTHWWFKGPDFLRHQKNEWPVESTPSNEILAPEDEEEIRVIFVASTQQTVLPQIERFSNWNKLIRATARILQFVEVLRSRRGNNAPIRAKRSRLPTRAAPTSNTSGRHIEPSHVQIQTAENLWIQHAQENSFPEEMKALRNGERVKNTSRIATLAPQLGGDDILRAAGRINAALGVADEVKKPVILDGRETYVRLLITHYHRRYLHANQETVVNEIRQRYWILRLRGVLRNIAHNCLWCNLRKGMPSAPPPGDLPRARLRHHARPFTATGVDYFGPMNVTVGRRQEKRYGALFTCLTTRAVHLELAASLSADSMILALRRMIARRGTPAEIYSDNGTNFIGARRELREARAELMSVGETAKQLHINWKTIPAGAPSAGGSWERLVRSIKTALAVTLRERAPREELLATLLLEAENIVNCRPLTHVSAHPEDEEALTPNHFLIGTSSGAPSPTLTTDRDLVGKHTWRTAQRLADHFWSRWVREYLPLLQPRGKPGTEKNLAIGDLVLIADHTLPRNTWPRGRVTQVYPGPDRRVRVADIQTAAGELRRRPVRRLLLLPTTEDK